MSKQKQRNSLLGNEAVKEIVPWQTVLCVWKDHGRFGIVNGVSIVPHCSMGVRLTEFHCYLYLYDRSRNLKWD